MKTAYGVVRIQDQYTKIKYFYTFAMNSIKMKS